MSSQDPTVQSLLDELTAADAEENPAADAAVDWIKGEAARTQAAVDAAKAAGPLNPAQIAAFQTAIQNSKDVATKLRAALDAPAEVPPTA